MGGGVYAAGGVAGGAWAEGDGEVLRDREEGKGGCRKSIASAVDMEYSTMPLLLFVGMFPGPADAPRLCLVRSTRSTFLAVKPSAEVFIASEGGNALRDEPAHLRGGRVGCVTVREYKEMSTGVGKAVAYLLEAHLHHC